MRTFCRFSAGLTGLVSATVLIAMFTAKSGVEASAQRTQLSAGDSTGLSVLYRFTGVSDDGEQGSANRKEATSIHCTNFDPLTPAEVEVQVFQWNGIDVYTGTLTLSPNRTSTFSTQNTSIYFEDVVLGGNPGTDAILQGTGRVLTGHLRVVCTVQVIDPLNNPPDFAVRLPLYDRSGNLVDLNPPDPDTTLPVIRH